MGGKPNRGTPVTRLSGETFEWNAPVVPHDHRIDDLELTAAEIRSHLMQLHGERDLAVSRGVADIDAYIADLDDEIAVVRAFYVAAAVTEIATLRAELFGAQVG